MDKDNHLPARNMGIEKKSIIDCLNVTLSSITKNSRALSLILNAKKLTKLKKNKKINVETQVKEMYSNIKLIMPKETTKVSIYTNVNIKLAIAERLIGTDITRNSGFPSPKSSSNAVLILAVLSGPGTLIKSPTTNIKIAGNNKLITKGR